MAYKPTSECTEAELAKRRATNKIRNDRYITNNLEKVKRSREKALETYRDNLRNNPEYVDRKLSTLEKSRKRANEWYYDNQEKAKLSSIRYRKIRDSKFPHLAVAKVQRRNACKLRALPLWADIKAIEDIYRKCREISVSTGIPHHVDHVIPLRGDLVCGLHVETNLAIIPASENVAKGNRFKIN